MPRLLFNQSITSIARATADKWGDKTWTILYQFVPCKFSYDTRRERLTEEERLTVVAVCYLPREFVIQEDDRVVYEGENYLVHRVAMVADLFGNTHHIKILLKSR